MISILSLNKNVNKKVKQTTESSIPLSTARVPPLCFIDNCCFQFNLLCLQNIIIGQNTKCPRSLSYKVRKVLGMKISGIRNGNANENKHSFYFPLLGNESHYPKNWGNNKFTNTFLTLIITLPTPLNPPNIKQIRDGN